MPQLLEDILDRVNKSGASQQQKQLMLRTLSEKGLLQNAPSEKFTAEQVTSILGTLANKGVISQFGTTESGNVAMPAATPDIDRKNAGLPTVGASSAATGDVSGGSDTPAPNAPGGVNLSTPGAPQGLNPSDQTEQSFYERLKAMGTGALQTIASNFIDSPTPEDVNPVELAKKGIEKVGQLATPENLKTMGSDWVAPNVGEAAGGVIGAGLGTMVAGPVGTAAGYVLGSAVGSGLGLMVGRTAAGKDVTLGEVGTEAAISFAPEFLESSARGVFHHLIKSAPKAQRIVEDLMAKWASTDAAKVFDPPSREKVDNLFSLVHQSNVKISGDALHRAFNGFGDRQWKRFQTELEGIGTQRYGSDLGVGMAETFDKIRGGAKGVEMNMGHIQDLRSQLLKRINLDNPTADDLAKKNLTDAFDREIDKMLATGNADAKLLKEAREQWSRYKAADTLQAFVSKPPVSRYDRALEHMSFDLSHLGQIIREPANNVQKKIAQDLKSIEGAEEAFKSWLGKMQGKRGVIEVSTTGLTVNQLMGVPAMIGNILVSVRGREAIEKILTTSRGPLDLNKLSLAFNAARRAADISTAGQTGSLEGIGSQATTLGVLEMPGMKRALGMQQY